MENILSDQLPSELDTSVIKNTSSTNTLKIGVVSLVLLLPIVGAVSYYFGKQSATIQQPLVTEQNTIVETPIKTANSVYQGRLSSFRFSYLASYQAEIQDVKESPTETIEQTVFKTQEQVPLESFSIRVDKGISELPQYPYDQPPTGQIEIGGVKGIYLELPEGYGDGGNFKPTPTTYVIFIKDNTMYQFSFSGVSDITQSQIQEIINSFSFSAVAIMDEENARGGGVEANWLTYTDQYSSYSLKYPPTWKLQKSTCATCEMNLIKPKSTLPDGSVDEQSVISILVFDTKAQALMDWKEETQVVSQTNFNWSNIQGINSTEKRYDPVALNDRVTMEVLYVEKGSKTYVIYTRPGILPVENAILSSLVLK